MPLSHPQLPKTRAASSSHSIASRLDETDGRPSGFDYIRVVLALCVICWHSQLTAYGGADRSIWQTILSPFAFLIVPMFFALSGFLVAGSLERSKTLITFLGLRVFRIMPALSVEVLLSALILGPLLTTKSLGEYFADPVFHSYFWNILGDIHYRLPGVFESNPVPLVNGQLWTVPYELVCYLVLTGLSVFGIFKRRQWLLIFLVVLYAAEIANTVFRPNADYKGAGGTTLLISFVAGLVVYRYREKIAWSKMLFAIAVVLSLILVNVSNGVRFVAIPAAYCVVYLGLLNPSKNKIILSGDYSYGLFLYGFPIQQAIMSIDPGLRQWYTNILISVPCAAFVAVCSWWFVEKPVLTHRGKLKQLENWYLAWRPVVGRTLNSADRTP